MKPVIELNDVSKHYGRQSALNHVSLEVPPGVVFALLGENGAGKTTMIRILLGLTIPDSGSATVLGIDSKKNGLLVRRRIGYVAERPALDEWIRVGELGWYAAGFYADGYLSRYRQQIDHFGVSPESKIRQLSKGMRSKVALSLALAHDPELLILDEPTSGLDTMVRREFLESMVDFTSAGKTVFLSSHQIHEVERVADIVAIIRGGEILVCEPLDELKRNVTIARLVLQSDAPVELPPGVICFEQRGRQGQLFARADESQTAALLRDMPRVEQLELRPASLEEIFVAFMNSNGNVSPIVEQREGVSR